MSPAGIGRHGACERLPRHRHAHAYVALVLDGGYEEAGDEGRFTATPGTVMVHAAWTAHHDRFGVRGARVLNLPAISGMTFGAGRITDPDVAARLAERSPLAASQYVRDNFCGGADQRTDWPDQLAEALCSDPDIFLSDWAQQMGLDPASVSRGFVRTYGVTPKRFRIEVRTRRALQALVHWRGNLAELAADQGFADQAHLTRSVAAMTGVTPQLFRAKSVQAGHRQPR